MIQTLWKRPCQISCRVSHHLTLSVISSWLVSGQFRHDCRYVVNFHWIIQEKGRVSCPHYIQIGWFWFRWNLPDLSYGPLYKEMATHSSILAWEIPRTEEPGGLQSMGSQESDTTSRLNHHHPPSCLVDAHLYQSLRSLVTQCGLQTSCTGFPWELSRNAALKCLTLKRRVSIPFYYSSGAPPSFHRGES